MSLNVTILGCGSSAGVPRVAQGWGACDSANPRNRRRRCAILVERPSGHLPTRLLVDAGPDLREQLILADVDRIDALLLTHAHADHIHGLDDVRPLTMAMHSKIDLYLDPPTWDAISNRFDYLFETPPGSNYPPLLIPHIVDYHSCFSHNGPGGSIDVQSFRMNHGDIDASGFRFGNFLYTPDVKYFPAEAEKYLENLDLWIVDALRYKSHPSHLSVSETLDLIKKYQPKHAILTNLHTDLDYEALKRILPDHVEPAYDMMRISL